MKEFVLAIDAGTTGITVILLNKSGDVVNKEYSEFKQYFPKSGWVEHDPIEIWDVTQNLLKKTFKKYSTDKIDSIGITNQRETTVVWNKKNGKPIYKAIVWQDRRTSNYCYKLKKLKKEKLIQKITGLILDPYFSATKIKWILENKKVFKKNLKEGNLLFGTIDTWLLWNLTEKKSHLTDITNASRTMLFNSKKEEWSKTLLKLFNIPISILPKVVENSYNFGTTKLFGDNIQIGGMAGDQQAATIGQACFYTGQSKSTYGTGCFLLMNIGDRFKISKNKLLTTVAFKINGKKMYCYEGSIFVAGSAIQWLRDKLYFFKNSSETSKLYSKSNPQEKIFVIPALTGLGAPHWKPNVKGAIFGLTRNTSIPDIIKAIIDSIAFQTLDLIKAMQKDAKIKIKEMKVDGGMINNSNFLQSLANITQIKIIKPKNIETTSLGAAYLAALHSGLIKNTQQIEKLWKKNKLVKPIINKKVIEKQYYNWNKIIKMLIKINS